MLWINIGFTYSHHNIPNKNVKAGSGRCVDDNGSATECIESDQQMPTYSQYKGPHPQYSEMTQVTGRSQGQYKSQQGFSIDTSHMIDTGSYGNGISPHHQNDTSKVCLLHPTILV